MKTIDYLLQKSIISGVLEKSRFHTAPLEIVVVRPVRRGVDPFSNKYFLETWSQFTGCYMCQVEGVVG